MDVSEVALILLRMRSRTLYLMDIKAGTEQMVARYHGKRHLKILTLARFEENFRVLEISLENRKITRVSNNKIINRWHSQGGRGGGEIPQKWEKLLYKNDVFPKALFLVVHFQK